MQAESPTFPPTNPHYRGYVVCPVQRRHREATPTPPRVQHYVVRIMIACGLFGLAVFKGKRAGALRTPAPFRESRAPNPLPPPPPYYPPRDQYPPGGWRKVVAGMLPGWYKTNQ